MKYCLPIIKSKLSDIYSTIESNFNEYDLFEIWLDYIEDLSLEAVSKIEKILDGRAIFLFRRQNLCPIKLPLSQRKEIIRNIHKGYLDLDILQQKEEYSLLREARFKGNLISSYHNYKLTPTLPELESIIAKMEAFAPKFYKISTYCQSEGDVVTLLETMLSLKEKGKNFIVLGMGAQGGLCRLAGALWGNEIAYTPLNKGEQSAPGQYTKDELKSILRLIRR